MLKNILNLKGTHQLTKEEQQSINGGSIPPDGGANCNQFVIVTASQSRCLAYGVDYRPEYLGSNRCSLLMPPC